MDCEGLIENLGNVALGVLAILYSSDDSQLFTPQEKAPMSSVALTVLQFRDELLAKQQG